MSMNTQMGKLTNKRLDIPENTVSGSIRTQIQICLTPKSVLFQKQASAQHTKQISKGEGEIFFQLVGLNTHTHTHSREFPAWLSG